MFRAIIPGTFGINTSVISVREYCMHIHGFGHCSGLKIRGCSKTMKLPPMFIKIGKNRKKLLKQ